MQTTKLTAPDIECEGCASSIKRALGAMPGIETVDVDIDTKVVTVTHAPEVGREALAAALVRAGFPVRN